MAPGDMTVVVGLVRVMGSYDKADVDSGVIAILRNSGIWRDCGLGEVEAAIAQYKSELDQNGQGGNKRAEAS
eukprot:11436058-Heterocapsa_arctica.AAC.1